MRVVKTIVASIPMFAPNDDIGIYQVSTYEMMPPLSLKRSEASFILWTILKNTDKICAKNEHLSIINSVSTLSLNQKIFVIVND